MNLRHSTLLVLLVACTADPAPRDAALDARPQPAVVRMDFTALPVDFYASPFPGEHRRRADGAPDLEGFPNPRAVGFVQSLAAVAARQPGFGSTSTVYFTLTAPIDPSTLPTPHSSLRPEATGYIVNLEANSEGFMQRSPVTAYYEDDGGPFGAPRLLSLLPLQGRPLRPETLYAAVLTTGIRGIDGTALRPPSVLTQWLAGAPPPGLSRAAMETYNRAFAALRAGGVDLQTLAGITVFRTSDPTRVMRAARAQTVPSRVPVLTRPLAPAEVFEDYCVFESTLRMPVFQRGEAPYVSAGGDWVTDASGLLVLQREEEARLWVTLPRRPMPAGGYPTAVFIRTGGGGERPLVDRGVQGPDGTALEAGSGPAREFARAGFAGVELDGPHGGLRNITRGDEQFLVFNITNPLALRDNIRQSALEIALLAHALVPMRIDARMCPGVSLPTGDMARFDTGTLALMGHSTGAAIAPLALAVEPMYRAAILSGAGGSWIANIVHKLRPVPTRPLAENIVRYSGIGREMREHDPVLGLLQWAGEEADTQVYAGGIVRTPGTLGGRHVLMIQGIVDNYILPPIANALSLSMGLDLAGDSLDRDPRLARFTPLAQLIELGPGRLIPLPARANVSATSSTAVVLQHPGDTLQDGHETVFQTDGPKYQYRCFLETFARGVPEVRVVPAENPLTAPCQ